MRLPALVLGLAIVAPAAQAGSPFYALDYHAAFNRIELARVDPVSGAWISGVPVTFGTGEEVWTTHGLSVDPTTGIMYAGLRLTGTPPLPVLATLDPGTGAGVIVGEMGDKFADITFDDSGQLYGVTGDGAAVPETLYRIDKATGAPTLLITLGNGDDGESICFNPDDGLIYHASGLSTPVFETIDPISLVVTNIPMTGGELPLGTSCMAYQGAGTLLAYDFVGFFDITTAGHISNPRSGTSGHAFKGMAFGPAPVGIERVSWAGTKSRFRR